ncbi:predicted protein [Uncinocarpus reesii 1704]|uniref:BZIP domain-containing protein n=1 Tax=Uncinocarpus reesii (strain UAMH 1704) TaxID=336963 RepID=C4JZA2_UNCRE|nr:uncharacterized protein UREG_07503 [Uncinocarpus reesii 1704]EEP82638.1 predicted protein [Uncinocarpus reesii 1704]
MGSLVDRNSALRDGISITAVVDEVAPKPELANVEGSCSSSISTPEPDVEVVPQDQAQRQKRKGGRKPIYATSEERKQRNRQAQAAFRERRTEYIKQLEATIKLNEDTLRTLQQSHRSAADECLMLRYKNSLLERILLEKARISHRHDYQGTSLTVRHLCVSRHSIDNQHINRRWGLYKDPLQPGFPIVRGLTMRILPKYNNSPPHPMSLLLPLLPIPPVSPYKQACPQLERKCTLSHNIKLDTLGRQYYPNPEVSVKGRMLP